VLSIHLTAQQWVFSVNTDTDGWRSKPKNPGMVKNPLLLPLRHLLTQPLTTQLAGIYVRCRLTTLYLLFTMVTLPNASAQSLVTWPHRLRQNLFRFRLISLKHIRICLIQYITKFFFQCKVCDRTNRLGCNISCECPFNIQYCNGPASMPIYWRNAGYRRNTKTFQLSIRNVISNKK